MITLKLLLTISAWSLGPILGAIAPKALTCSVNYNPTRPWQNHIPDSCYFHIIIFGFDEKLLKWG